MTVADATLAALTAGLSPVPVCDAKVPDTPPDRYVVQYPDAGTLWSETVDVSSDLATFRVRVVYVTRGPQAGRAGVEFLARKAREALVGRFLSVPGWALGPMLMDPTSEPIRRDDDEPGAVVLFASDSFVVTGARA